VELRQLKYFLKVVECGSLGRAALELDIGTSALSQQISKLESELATRLLNRTSTGALPTSAGIAFMHHAQLALRQTEQAVIAAQYAECASAGSCLGVSCRQRTSLEHSSPA